MAVLRKANSYLLEICRLMKNQWCKRRSKRKADINFDFFQDAKYLWCFKKKECSAYYRNLFYIKKHNKVDLGLAIDERKADIGNSGS